MSTTSLTVSGGWEVRERASPAVGRRQLGHESELILRLHPVVANLALLGGSLIVALGATELVLRLAPRLISVDAGLRLSLQEQKLSHAARPRPDSAIGFLSLPGGRDEVRQGDVRFSYRTDRDG